MSGIFHQETEQALKFYMTLNHQVSPENSILPHLKLILPSPRIVLVNTVSTKSVPISALPDLGIKVVSEQLILIYFSDKWLATCNSGTSTPCLSFYSSCLCPLSSFPLDQTHPLPPFLSFLSISCANVSQKKNKNGNKPVLFLPLLFLRFLLRSFTFPITFLAHHI